jgi:predicted RNA-binding protein with PUA-like domain
MDNKIIQAKLVLPTNNDNDGINAFSFSNNNNIIKTEPLYLYHFNCNGSGVSGVSGVSEVSNVNSNEIDMNENVFQLKPPYNENNDVNNDDNNDVSNKLLLSPIKRSTACREVNSWSYKPHFAPLLGISYNDIKDKHERYVKNYNLLLKLNE